MTAEVRGADVVVIGAGAAGLAAAVFCARASPGLRIRCIDGARHVGAKILVSGGSRCNVTNRVVTERDFWGGSPRTIQRVLRAFPAPQAAAFFETLGVRLHEEEDGKLFPDSNRSRDVLDALLAEIALLGIELVSDCRVTTVDRDQEHFQVGTADGSQLHTRAVVLATGGRALPRSGSDGFGYVLARRLGHGMVETSPALAPLVLDRGPHQRLSGIAHPAGIAVRVDGRIATRLEGALLWTHFGVSGPVVLNASRHWHRARMEGADVTLLLSVCPGETFEVVEEWLLDRQRERPRARVSSVVATRLPAAVADALVDCAAIAPEATLAHLGRDERRALVRVLVELPLVVRDSRGYTFAEVTAGGVPLDEIDPASMQSRVCPGLYLAGEILDVDGRLGGFNFQWAWSSGWVAGNAIARALAADGAGRRG